MHVYNFKKIKENSHTFKTLNDIGNFCRFSRYLIIYDKQHWAVHSDFQEIIKKVKETEKILDHKYRIHVNLWK